MVDVRLFPADFNPDPLRDALHEARLEFEGKFKAAVRQDELPSSHLEALVSGYDPKGLEYHYPIITWHHITSRGWCDKNVIETPLRAIQTWAQAARAVWPILPSSYLVWIRFPELICEATCVSEAGQLDGVFTVEATCYSVGKAKERPGG